MATKPPALDSPLLRNTWFTKEINALPPPASNHTTNPSAELKEALACLNGRCFYCGKILPVLYASWDHVVPLSAGGLNDPSNRVVCCYFCNNKKADFNLTQWRQMAWGNNSSKFYGEWLAGSLITSTVNRNGILGKNSSNPDYPYIPSPSEIMETRLTAMRHRIRNSIALFVKEAEAGYFLSYAETFSLDITPAERETFDKVSPEWESAMVSHLHGRGWYCYWNDGAKMFIIKPLYLTIEYVQPSQDTTETPEGQEPTTEG